MSNIIDKIRLSGTDYTLSATTSGVSVIEVTQAQYDALPTSAKTDTSKMYVITDAEAGDLTQYWTSAQTQSAITQAVSGKADSSDVYLKSETSGATEISTALGNKQDTLVSGTNIKTINNESILGSGNITIQGGGTDTGTVQTMIDQSISGKADSSTVTALTNTVTAHTANTTVHVTAQDKTNWNAKSDFSGSYNDLTDKPTIPTVPTSNTAFTNDAGYITSSALNGYATTGDVQTATSGKVDTSTYTAYTASTDAALATKQTTLTAGTGIDITDNVISATGGGGSTYTAGRGIDITNDIISISLPISAGTGTNSIIENDANNVASGQYSHAEGQITSAITSYAHAEGKATIARGAYSHAEGWQNTASGQSSHAEGKNTKANGDRSHAEGWQTISKGSNSHAEGSSSYASGQNSHAEGYITSANTEASHAEGQATYTSNKSEHASGQYNVSSSASTTFGDSGNTLFSVGNGTSNSARHNAFEIRQNGDIYISSGGTDIKLQDYLGGGGSSINVVQTTGSSTTDVMSQAAVTNIIGDIETLLSNI